MCVYMHAYTVGILVSVCRCTDMCSYVCLYAYTVGIIVSVCRCTDMCLCTGGLQLQKSARQPLRIQIPVMCSQMEVYRTTSSSCRRGLGGGFIFLLIYLLRFRMELYELPLPPVGRFLVSVSIFFGLTSVPVRSCFIGILFRCTRCDLLAFFSRFVCDLFIHIYFAMCFREKGDRFVVKITACRK